MARMFLAKGYLLDKSIVGAEPTPLITYLLALLISELVLRLNGGDLIRR